MLTKSKRMPTAATRPVVLSIVHQIRLVVSCMNLGRRTVNSGFRVRHHLPNGEAIVNVVAEEIRSKKAFCFKIDVFASPNTLSWPEALRHPDEVPRSFYSFKRHSEDRAHDNGRGHFALGGRIPAATDDRVDFIKGWFEDILPPFTAPEREVQVTAAGADSRSLATNALCRYQFNKERSILPFLDGMFRPGHRPRAFHERMHVTRRQLRLVCRSVAQRGISSMFRLNPPSCPGFRRVDLPVSARYLKTAGSPHPGELVVKFRRSSVDAPAQLLLKKLSDLSHSGESPS